MLRDLIEEAEKWELAPKAASQWWTSTYEPAERSGLSIDTKSGLHNFLFDGKFKILGCAMFRQGKTHDAIVERMQSASRACWKDILVLQK